MIAWLKTAPLLNLALLADAVASFLSGVFMVGGSTVLPRWLGLPSGLLLYAGLFCIAYAAFVGALGARRHVPRRIAWFVVGGNLVWAFESVMMMELGWVSPTPTGVVFVLGQAAVVLALALVQYTGLRQTRPAMA
ncbi:MAG: hypothetical protein FJX47_19955 [Alphaproteobacteria bacterium]|nr:hypothetical protein [Alphaproteobacteria bacterium]